MMNLKKVTKGKWYETSIGYGECVSTARTFPPSVEFNITHPFPRGKQHVSPRDIIRELTDAEATRLSFDGNKL